MDSRREDRERERDLLMRKEKNRSTCPRDDDANLSPIHGRDHTKKESPEKREEGISFFFSFADYVLREKSLIFRKSFIIKTQKQ
jgi:hypothetical protein